MLIHEFWACWYFIRAFLMADPIIETLATILVMDYVSCCNTCWMHAHCDIREKIHNYTKHLSILPLKVCVVEVFIIDLLVSSSKYFVCNVYVLDVQKILSNAFLIMNNFFAHIYLNFDFFLSNIDWCHLVCLSSDMPWVPVSIFTSQIKLSSLISKNTLNP